MAPVTVTSTSVLNSTHALDYTEYKLEDNGKKADAMNNTTTSKRDPYDEVLLNDPYFLVPLRKLEKRLGFITPILWKNALIIITLHMITVVFVFKCVIPTFRLPTFLFSVLMGQVAGFGVTAGAHRFWCHRSYKAKLPLQIILALCYSVAGQNTIYNWVRDHRVHHKFSETSADPHDAKRGFFFSHVGWLMMKKHPDVLKEGAKIDMSDITNDPVVRFHTKYFLLLQIILCWIVPSLIPIYLWDEDWDIAVVSQVFLRYMLSLNCTWSVNSFAHLWGNKPYDRHIMPSENKGVSIVAMGEGWHNYHHTFPWDYKAAEFGTANNTTTSLLDLFAQIGWAYDLKEASPTLVKAVAKNRGEPRK